MAVLAAYTILQQGYTISNRGIHVALRDLLCVFTTVSCGQTLLGTVTLSNGPFTHEDPDLSIARPSLAHRIENTFHLVAKKLAAPFLGPLLYIALSFNVHDYAELALRQKRRWRSSFKFLSVLLALFGIGFFLFKIVLYSTWSYVANLWELYLPWLTAPVAPISFPPWHLASLMNSILTIILLAQVDAVIYQIDDRQTHPSNLQRRLVTMNFGFRIQRLLSFYTWFCVIWLSTPYLAKLQFPPISLQLFPKSL
jgi:hypothetical protein